MAGACPLPQRSSELGGPIESLSRSRGAYEADYSPKARGADRREQLKRRLVKQKRLAQAGLGERDREEAAERRGRSRKRSLGAGSRKKFDHAALGETKRRQGGWVPGWFAAVRPGRPSTKSARRADARAGHATRSARSLKAAVAAGTAGQGRSFVPPPRGSSGPRSGRAARADALLERKRAARAA